MYLNTELATPPVTMPAAPFKTSGIHTEAIEDIIELARQRQDQIKAKTKLALQAQAILRRYFDGDKNQAAEAYRAAKGNPDHEYYGDISVHLVAEELFEKQKNVFEKEMVRRVKGLPIYKWAKDIKGLGDNTFAVIIGECSGYHRDTGEFYSLGDFKSVSAVWKRMGLAVINGERQRKKSGDEALIHGYSPTRRAVMWNAGNNLILGFGKFRPVFGEVIDDNPEYTDLQKVFANRARYEAERLPHKTGEPIKESKTGKDSYTAHAANRAKRYAEKRLLRMMFAEWRRCMG